MCAAKPPHKQCVRISGLGSDADRSQQVARKTPLDIWSLSQDATEKRHYRMVDSKLTRCLHLFPISASNRFLKGLQLTALQDQFGRSFLRKPTVSK